MRRRRSWSDRREGLCALARMGFYARCASPIRPRAERYQALRPRGDVARATRGIGLAVCMSWRVCWPIARARILRAVRVRRRATTPIGVERGKPVAADNAAMKWRAWGPPSNARSSASFVWPLDQRTQSDARAFDVVVTAGAAHSEVAVSGRGDLKSHVASDEFETVVGADAAALQVGAEGGAASRARHRRVRDFSAHHNRLTAPMPFRAGLFAGALGGLVLVQLAGFLGRSVGNRRRSRPGLWRSASPWPAPARRPRTTT